jgi:iron(III) transport system substrate-binding protein
MKRALALMCLACSCGDGAPRQEVVAYVSLDEMFSKPILEDFEKSTGIKVVYVADQEAQKTTGLMNKLIQMKDRPEADIFWNNETMRSVVLKEKGVLEKYVPSTAADLPERHKDPEGYWVGFAARARVILYNTNMVKEAEAPRSIYDFLKPEWKGRFTIANPMFGTTSTHFAALYAALGPDKAEELLRGLKQNGCQVSPGNAMARNMVMDGQIDACLTDTDDANGALLQGKPVKMVFPDQDGIGALVIPNSVVLIKGGPNPANAKKLIDYIASRQVEARLAKIKSAQMPLRAGIEPYSPLFDLSKVKTMEVDIHKAASMLDRSNRFIEEVFNR